MTCINATPIMIQLTVSIFKSLGSLKVWDFGSGQVLKERQGRTTDEDLSITGLAFYFLAGDRVILASGWNNKIKMILVS